MTDEPRFARGPLPSPLGPEDEARLREFAAANPEAAKRYAERPINPDLYEHAPKYKTACTVVCPFCQEHFEYIEDRIENGETVYVAVHDRRVQLPGGVYGGCYLTKQEFEWTRAQLLAWQDYVEDPNCDDLTDKLIEYLPEQFQPKRPWWKRLRRWLTRWRR